MTQEELHEKYTKLYEYMAASKEARYMKLFGSVMTEMMEWMIKNQPTAAESWIERLCSIKWEQYLTKQEAAKIVDKMEPEAPWDYDTWKRAMSQYALETERKGVFNCFALWTWMNAKYTDEAETLAKFAFGRPLNEVPTDKMVTLVHALAVSNLTDEDGVFDIRAYFDCD